MNLKKILCEVMMEEPDAITLDSDYRSVALWDSLKQIELIHRIESECGQRFTPKELSQMSTVRGIRGRLEDRGIPCEGFDPGPSESG